MSLQRQRINHVDQFVTALEAMGVYLARGVLRRAAQAGDIDDFLAQLVPMAQDAAARRQSEDEALAGPIGEGNAGDRRRQRNDIAQMAARVSQPGR